MEADALSLADVIAASDEACSEVDRLWRTVVAAGVSLFGGRSDANEVSSVEDLRGTIWDLRRTLRIAMGDGADKELVALLNAVGESREAIERAVVVWIDLIESLAQSAERSYGAKPGRGALKAEVVREALRRLIGARHFRIPNLPAFLRPIVVDVAADWLIDSVVLVLNRYGMWVDVKPSPASFRTRLVLGLRRLAYFARVLFYPGAWLFSRLWVAGRTRVPLPPEVRRALAAVEQDGLLRQQGRLLGSVADFVAWAGAHRKQVIASLELVFAAVHEAEGYLELSGPEKKAYARNLVVAVLEDIGWRRSAELMGAGVEAIIGGSIEAAVQLFNKRGVFAHRSIPAGV
jgi:hypothetical protein